MVAFTFDHGTAVLLTARLCGMVLIAFTFFFSLFLWVGPRESNFSFRFSVTASDDTLHAVALHEVVWHYITLGNFYGTLQQQSRWQGARKFEVRAPFVASSACPRSSSGWCTASNTLCAQYHTFITIGNRQEYRCCKEHMLACSFSYWATVRMPYLTVVAMVVRSL